MHGKQKRQRTYAIAVFAIMMSAVAVFLYVAAPWRVNDYDEKTLCPKNGQYLRTAILIDATDSLEESQIKSLLEATTDLRNRLELYEWVGVFVLNEGNLTVPKPEIALCNPGNEDTANPLYQNPREIKRKFEKQFAKPLRRTIEKLASLPKQDRSPIIEMIRSVALSFDFDSSQKRKLIIVSDMLQYVDEYSHYDGKVDYAAWKKTPYAAEFLDLPLSEVEVEIWYVKRPDLGKLQTHRHIQFWVDFFKDAGANLKKNIKSL